MTAVDNRLTSDRSARHTSTVALGANRIGMVRTIRILFALAAWSTVALTGAAVAYVEGKLFRGFIAMVGVCVGQLTGQLMEVVENTVKKIESI